MFHQLKSILFVQNEYHLLKRKIKTKPSKIFTILFHLQLYNSNKSNRNPVLANPSLSQLGNVLGHIGGGRVGQRDGLFLAHFCNETKRKQISKASPQNLSRTVSGPQPGLDAAALPDQDRQLRVVALQGRVLAADELPAKIKENVIV